MSRYINWQDVANRYPKVADKVGAGSAEAEGYIQGAEGEVDAALVDKYGAPFIPGSSNVPYLVRDICVDLAYWKAMGWQNEKLGPIQKAYIDARLKQFMDGTILLTDVNGTIYQGPPFAAATSDGTRSSFGVDAPENWTVSSAWQDDYASARIGDNDV
jgi:hypothetical protein